MLLFMPFIFHLPVKGLNFLFSVLFVSLGQGQKLLSFLRKIFRDFLFRFLNFSDFQRVCLRFVICIFFWNTKCLFDILVLIIGVLICISLLILLSESFIQFRTHFEFESKILFPEFVTYIKFFSIIFILSNVSHNFLNKALKIKPMILSNSIDLT